MAVVGTVVKSLSGKDRGQLLVVVGSDAHRWLVADGRRRKLQRLWAFEMRERRRRNKKNLRRSLVKRIKPFR